MADLRAGILYVDTSALVKLLIREAESDALEEELHGWPGIATSVITSIELARAIGRARSDLNAVVADDLTVLAVLASVAEIPLDADIRANASSLAPPELRTLDAIHLASALALGEALGGILTYDHRMHRGWARPRHPGVGSRASAPHTRLERRPRRPELSDLIRPRPTRKPCLVGIPKPADVIPTQLISEPPNRP